MDHHTREQIARRLYNCGYLVALHDSATSWDHLTQTNREQWLRMADVIRQAVAEEREACAAIAYVGDVRPDGEQPAALAAWRIARVIRARG